MQGTRDPDVPRAGLCSAYRELEVMLGQGKVVAMLWWAVSIGESWLLWNVSGSERLCWTSNP